jgi:hypothetical protein
VRAAAHRRQLDTALLAWRQLWHPQPFREARPAWCEQWPALTAALLALSDADAAHLNDDAPAALRWLAAYLPEVDGLLPLIDIPVAENTPPSVPGERWAWEIPGRKRAQIEAFASAVQPGGAGVIDWCGGKGHLGRLLGLAWQQPVHTLEIDAALCADGEQLAGRIGLDHRFLERDALAVADWPRPGQQAVALHACGNLHRRLVEHGAGAGVARFDVAPCCYYRGVNTHYQPLSAGGQLQLSRDDTRLAVTETVTASPRLTRQRDHGIAWKLAFTAWREQVGGVAYKTFKPVPAPWLSGSIADFLANIAGARSTSSGRHRSRWLATSAGSPAPVHPAPCLPPRPRTLACPRPGRLPGRTWLRAQSQHLLRPPADAAQPAADRSPDVTAGAARKISILGKISGRP